MNLIFVKTTSAIIVLVSILSSCSALCAAEDDRLKDIGSVNSLGGVVGSDNSATLLESPGVTILSSEVKVPDGIKIGQYRRVLQPFPNWTLVCDENLSVNRKVCNISQKFVNLNNEFVFSWSLASNEEGKPYFILRTPKSTKDNNYIRLAIPDGEGAFDIPVKACSDTICFAYLPVGSRLRSAVENNLVIRVNYFSSQKNIPITITAPMMGLALALDAI